jgi:hypothetical protein
VPKGFQLRFLLRRGQDLNLQVVTKDLISNLEKTDTSLAPSLFGFDLQLPLTVKIPSDMQDEEICMRVVLVRASDCVDRQAHFCAKGGFATQGKLDFSKGGCFYVETNEQHITPRAPLLWQQGRCSKQGTLDGDFELIDSEFDWKASPACNPIQHFDHTWFGNDAPFKKTMYTAGRQASQLALGCREVAPVVVEERAKRNTSDSIVLEDGGDGA